MKGKIILFFLIFFSEMQGQPLPFSDILRAVEANNKDLRLYRQQNAVQEQTDRTQNNLNDPAIEYIHQWGTPGQVGNATELNVTQSFDFPTVYAQRNKLNRERVTWYEYHYLELRREVLLQAEKLCYDLVLVNKKLELTLHQLEQVRWLHPEYQQLVEEGYLTRLQGQKLKMELMNLQVTESNLRADRKVLLQQLALLNGEVRLDIAADRFLPVRELVSFEQLWAGTVHRNPSLASRQQEEKVAEREIGVNLHQHLPSLEIGYRRTTGFEEEFNGVILGLSVPLFQNRGKVKQARLQRQFAGMRYETARTGAENELRTAYAEALTLKQLLDEYSEVTTEQDWCQDLKRAYMAHEMTTIEYFSKMSSVHGAYLTRLELENRYYKAVADLYKDHL